MAYKAYGNFFRRDPVIARRALMIYRYEVVGTGFGAEFKHTPRSLYDALPAMTFHGSNNVRGAFEKRLELYRSEFVGALGHFAGRHVIVEKDEATRTMMDMPRLLDITPEEQDMYHQYGEALQQFGRTVTKYEREQEAVDAPALYRAAANVSKLVVPENWRVYDSTIPEGAKSVQSFGTNTYLEAVASIPLTSLD